MRTLHRATRRRVGARLLLGVGLLWVLLGTNGLAGADGAEPTNFEAVLDRVEPAVDTVEVEVLGGDAFLQVRAEPGTEVRIPGYDGEDYLWITNEGTVLRNRNSPSAYLNVSRTGDVGRLPEGVRADAEPDWQVVGDDGTVAWHDHRIHWMLADTPAFDDGEVVQEWIVPITVRSGGQRTEVELQGRLVHRGDTLPWTAAVGAVAAVGLWWVLRSRPSARARTLTAAATVATFVSLVELRDQPAGADPSLIPIALALVAVAAAAAAVPTGSATRRRTFALAAAAALIGWFVTRIGVIWKPLLPGPLPDTASRLLSAAALGVALAVASATLSDPEVDDVQESTRSSSGSQS